MNISILTVFPELYAPFLRTSLIGRAQQNGSVAINVTSFFSFVAPKERIDAPVFGHGAGMLIRPDIVEKAINEREQAFGTAYTIFFSPHGTVLDQPLLRTITQRVQEVGHVLCVAGRYEGMDTRVEEYYADSILSVGNFVLMGGDIPTMTLLEGMMRLIPGVVGKELSVEEESFSGPFVDYPAYTQPVVWRGMQVPDIVRSGNHAAIQAWQLQEAARRSVQYHFNWVRSHRMTSEQRSVAKKYIPSHYVALLHSDVLIGQERAEGTTSVTSIDIHDIARSSATYDIQTFFLVTPLRDQQKIVKKLLDFWIEGEGTEYNYNRHSALRRVSLQSTLQDAIAEIEKKEGKKPIIIATSARMVEENKTISFYDQEKVWAFGQPVLFIFGTGRGLSATVLEQADFVVLPVCGFTDFNHLSVRSAVAVILDRWLGINEHKV